LAKPFKSLITIHPKHLVGAFGRKVKGFDQEKWNAERFDIVYRGNVAKFDQNEELGEFLGSTYGTILVEAAGRDTIWGIGLGQSNPKAKDPGTWRGRNLLGFVLTKVRALDFA